MIEAYTGTPGSGKTYHAVYDMWEALKYGRPVISNIPLDLPEKLLGKKREWRNWRFVEIYDIKPFMLYQLSESIREQKGFKRVPEDYILLVIDEAQLIFNCRDWQAQDRKEWLSFFQQHRKLGYHVVLITQMAQMLDKHAQGLLEYEIVHRKFSNFGWKGKLVSLVLLSPTMFSAMRVWACMKTRIDAKVFRYSRRIARLYDTAKTY